MQSKIILRWTLVFVLFVFVVFRLILGNPDQGESTRLTANTAVLYEQENTTPGLPVRLEIPTLNIDASVEHVGVTDFGSMDVPENPDNVAWFDLGPRPGEKGSSVMDGHAGWSEGKAAVFDNLYKVRKGDKVFVTDDKGITLTFIVRETRRYDPGGDSSYVFSSNDGKSHLNLITCEGEWDKVSRSSSIRLVVFTDKE